MLLVRRSRSQRDRILAGVQRVTLSELQVEDVFARRLALETTEEAQQQRTEQLFNETLHSLNGEDRL